MSERSISKAKVAQALGIGAGPLRSRISGQARWRTEEVPALEQLLGEKLLQASGGKKRR